MHIFGWIIVGTAATKCEFCHKEFSCIGRHVWRCPARSTSAQATRPTSPPDGPGVQPSVSSIAAPVIPPIPIEQLKCVCGRMCKGRRGLTAHKRSCKIISAIDLGSSQLLSTCDATLVPNILLNTNSTTASSLTSITSSQRRDNPIPPSPDLQDPPLPTLAGIRLPKSSSKWLEANLYFQLTLDLSNQTIVDTNEYTENLQRTIYEYFAQTEGTITNERQLSFEAKYHTSTVKQLKRSLAQLKALDKNRDEIIYLSKLIRSRISPRKDCREETSSLEASLSKSFWKTCKTIFNDSKTVTPTFSMRTGVEYFRSVLADSDRSKSFTVPSWIPNLPPPRSVAVESAPTYQEVSRAINRVKSKVCPCPLDQMSILVLKHCPILRTALHKLIVHIWNGAPIPSCWKRGFTIPIYKKGEPNVPSNFRPITLQPVFYKVFSSVIRDRLFSFLDSNHYLDNHVQKGFWPGVDGVGEHSQLLAHVIKEAKAHQRSMTVTLLDLRNAFGEVHHNLIKCSLTYHHVPNRLMNIINSTFVDTTVQVAVNDVCTPCVRVERGVLQGDPISPLLFNVCCNTLMQAISKPEYQQLGYLWGPPGDNHYRACMQFADDAALVAQSIKSAQILLNLYVGWCDWAGMTLRTDKCIAFGMAKNSGQFEQTYPALFVSGVAIPVVQHNECFKYLGCDYSFAMDNSTNKASLLDKVESILRKISLLKIRPQTKLRLVSKFLPTKISYELKSHDISLTWINQQLDPIIYKRIREWLELPISTCVEEMLELPKNKGGFGIQSLKHLTESLRMGQRFRLKWSRNSDMRTLWSETSHRAVCLDEVINASKDCTAALKTLSTKRTNEAFFHINQLTLQGPLLGEINHALTKTSITRWSNLTDHLSASLFQFVRKAVQNQLPTASNLARWKKISNPACPLCQKLQTNKHVLSNCGSISALERYKGRHDKVLTILADWIQTAKKSNALMHVDIIHPSYGKISDVFETKRPDIVLVCENNVSTLELTVCHESNIVKSREYKDNKYSKLADDLKAQYKSCKLNRYTVEVTSLGFVSDIKAFCSTNLTMCIPNSILNNISNSVIKSSYSIYCLRNKVDRTL